MIDHKPAQNISEHFRAIRARAQTEENLTCLFEDITPTFCRSDRITIKRRDLEKRGYYGVNTIPANSSIMPLYHAVNTDRLPPIGTMNDNRINPPSDNQKIEGITSPLELAQS